jgi:hypothetical protein
MYTPLITISAIIAAAILLVMAPVAFDTYRQYRKRRVVICPDNQKLAEVDVKAGRAGLMSAFGMTKLAVKWCSRWPHKQGCAQGCMKENSAIP